MTGAPPPFVLPRVPASSGALIFDDGGRLLVVNPTYKAHWKNGFYGQGGYEFSLLLGTVALSLGLTGPGRLSVDHLVGSKGR